MYNKNEKTEMTDRQTDYSECSLHSDWKWLTVRDMNSFDLGLCIADEMHSFREAWKKKVIDQLAVHMCLKNNR